MGRAKAQGVRARRFAAEIKKLRLTLGKRSSYDQVSQRLAERGVRISGSALHRYESEGRIPDLLTVAVLADVYRVDRYHLFDLIVGELLGDKPRPVDVTPHDEARALREQQDMMRDGLIQIAATAARLIGETGEASPAPKAGKARRRDLRVVKDDEQPTLANVEHNDEDFVWVGILEDAIAAGPPRIIDETRLEPQPMPFRRRWLEEQNVGRALCVRVGPYERSMVDTINPGEVVLLDTSDERRLKLQNDQIYAVNFEGGTTLKRVIVVPQGLLLVSDNPDKSDDRYQTKACPVEVEQDLRAVIVGRVMWHGQPI